MHIHLHNAETNMFAHYIAGTIFCSKCLLASLGITCLHDIFAIGTPTSHPSSMADKKASGKRLPKAFDDEE